ncbi:MAG: PH domain-containing protein [Actinobacteria bacterium]|nr:PH domain-containing protein [Actinomycetota bacterium]
MAYPSRALADGETLVMEVKPHWVSLGWPLVVAALAIAVALMVIVAVPSAPAAVVYILVVLILLAGAWLGFRAMRRAATSIVLTSLRLVERRGVIGRSTLEIRLDRINNVSTRIPLLGRLLGFGDLQVDMGGERGVSVFTYLPKPDSISGLIAEQISYLLHSGGTYGQQVPVNGAPANSAPANSTYSSQQREWQQAMDQAGLAPGPRETISGMQGSGAYGVPAGTMPDDTPPQGVFGVRDLRGPQRPRTVADRMMELEQLRKMGTITEEEFNAKKAQLLQQL